MSTDTIDKSEVENIHDAKHVSRMRRMPRRVGVQGVATTDGYSIVSGTEMQVGDCDTIKYVVTENGTNSSDFKVVARMYDKDGNTSAWIDQVEQTAVSDANAELDPGNSDYDEYALMAAPNAGGSQGDFDAFGLAKSTA